MSTDTVNIDNAVREWECSCGHKWTAKVELSATSARLSGEKTEYCPKCGKRPLIGSPWKDTRLAPCKMKRAWSKGRTRYIVEAEIEKAQIVAPYLTTNLLPADRENTMSLSMTGEVYEGTRWSSGGQIRDELKAAFPDDTEVQRLCEIWKRWHMCDGKSGSTEQQAVIDDWEAKGYPNSKNKGRYDYESACEVLAFANKLDVPIPNKVSYHLTRTTGPMLYNSEPLRARVQKLESGTYPTSADAYKVRQTLRLITMGDGADWKVDFKPAMYHYGSAWLSEALPAEIAEEVKTLMSIESRDGNGAV